MVVRSYQLFGNPLVYLTFFWFYHIVCQKNLHENVFVGCVNYDNVNVNDCFA